MHLPEGKQFTPAPAGSHVAVCIGFIDLGTQKSDYMGEVSYKRLVTIRWELVDEMMEDGKPFTISKRYTWSMSDKANLRKDLESWRGKPFTKEDFGPTGFDTRKLLGVPCLLNVVHKAKNNGDTFANIAGISPLPKGMARPGKAQNPETYFALEPGSFDKATFAKLHDKVRETVALSPEYQALTRGAAPADEMGGYHTGADLDDEIPF
jgi:hypothetical protein